MHGSMATSLLDRGAARYRVALSALIAWHFSGTLFEELFEALVPDERPLPWQDSKKAHEHGDACCVMHVQRDDAWRSVINFLDTFSGRRFDVPEKSSFTQLIHEAGIYTEIVEDGRPARDVAEARELTVDAVEAIVERVRSVIASVSGTNVRSGGVLNS